MATNGSLADDNLDHQRKRIRGLLDKYCSKRDDPNKRFFRYGLAKTLLHEDNFKPLFRALDEARNQPQDEKQFMRRLERIRGESPESGRCNVLAILIYSKCDHSALRRFEDIFFNNDDKSTAGEPTNQNGVKATETDGELPFDKETCNRLFGDDTGNLFWNTQFSFCPVVLKHTKRRVYTGHKKFCPLPFLEREMIGEGAFGKVFKVKVERDHFHEDHYKGENHEEGIYLACKEFAVADLSSFTRELETVERIILNVKTHSGIMETLAILEHGDTYSLFSDLADCDLSVWLNDKKIPKPKNLAEKKAIYHRVIEIAEALTYLHEDLETDDFKQLRCYHLDLKPQNILVFKDSEGNDTWKISDFGISKVKEVSDNRESDEIDFDNVFEKRRPADTTSETGTVDHRFAGTYTPPEARSPHRKMDRSSDWWSFGCVLILVMTYLDGGARAVIDFGKYRLDGPAEGHQQLEKRHDDMFYTVDSKTSDLRVNDYVLQWFERLREHASGKEGEQEIVDRTLTLVKDCMLIPDQRRRRHETSRKDIIVKELKSIYQLFPEQQAEKSTSEEPASDSSTSDHVHQSDSGSEEQDLVSPEGTSSGGTPAMHHEKRKSDQEADETPPEKRRKSLNDLKPETRSSIQATEKQPFNGLAGRIAEKQTALHQLA